MAIFYYNGTGPQGSEDGSSASNASGSTAAAIAALSGGVEVTDGTFTLTAAQASGQSITGAGNVVVTAIDQALTANLSGITVLGSKTGTFENTATFTGNFGLVAVTVSASKVLTASASVLQNGSVVVTGDVALTDTSLAATVLNAVNNNTSGVLSAASLTSLTGAASDVMAAYSANNAGTITGLGDEAVTLSGSTSVSDVNSVDGSTSGVITATITETAISSLSGLTGTGNAYTITVNDASVDAGALNTLDGKTTVNVNAGSVGTLTGSAAAIDTAINAGTIDTGAAVAVNVNSGSATVAQANSIDAQTTGVVTATISETAISTLSGLTGTGNAYTISVNDASVDAGALNTLDGKTTVNLNAGSVGTLTGSAADIATAISATTIDTGAAVIATVTGNATVAQVNTIDTNTTGVVTATISDHDISTLAGLNNSTGNAYTISVTDASVDAADLNTLDGKTTVNVDAGSVGTLTGTAAAINTAINASTIDTGAAVSVHVNSGSATVAQANSIDAQTTGVVTATITETAISSLSGLTGSGNAYTISVNDASVDAAALNTLDGKTTVNVNAGSVGTLTGTAAAIDTAINASTIDTGAAVVVTVSSGSTTVAQANSIDAQTTGVVTATISETAISTLSALTGTGNAYSITVTDASVDAAALNTLDGKTTVNVNAGSVGTLTGTAAAIDTAINASTIDTGSAVLVNVNSGSATVAQANSIDAQTTGVVTATISQGDLTTLATLTGTGNAYTVTLSDTNAAASALTTLDGKTTVAVNAGSVTTLSGTAAEVTAAYTANTAGSISGLGDEAVTLSDTTLAATALNAVNSNTTGVVNATSVTTLTGLLADVNTAYAANAANTISGLGDEAVTITNGTGTLLATDLSTAGNATTGTVTVTNTQTVAGTVAEVTAALVTASTKVVMGTASTASISDVATAAQGAPIATTANITANFSLGIVDSLANFASSSTISSNLASITADQSNVVITISNSAGGTVPAADLSAIGNATTGTVTVTNAQTVNGTADEVIAAVVTTASKVNLNTGSTINASTYNTQDLSGVDAAFTLNVTTINGAVLDATKLATADSVTLVGTNTATGAHADTLGSRLGGTATLNITTDPITANTDLSDLGTGLSLQFGGDTTAVVTGATLTVRQDQVSGYAISGTGTVAAAGTANSDTFDASSITATTNFTSLGGNDRVTMAPSALGSADSIDGGSGSDTLTFSAAGTVVDGAFTYVSSVEVLQLAAGSNSITLGVEAEQAGISTVTGDSGADTLNLLYGTTALTFNAGTGTDTLSYSADSAAQAITLSGISSGTASGSVVNNATDSFTGLEAIVGGSGTGDTITSTSAAEALIVTGANAGTIDGFSFSGVESVDLGAGNNSGTINTGGSLSGSLTFGSGTDTLTYASYGSAVSASLSGTNTLTSITAINGGVTGVDNLTLSSSNDTLTVGSSGSLSGNVDFGTGSDTLSYAGNSTAVTVSLNGPTSTAAAGATGITGTTTGFETLIGGSGSSDILNATSGGNAISVASNGTTTLDTNLTVSAFETINLGANSDASADTATISGAFSGTMDLGDGADTATINNGGSVTSLVGGAGSDTLNLDGANQTITVTGTGAGTTVGTTGATTTFSGFETVNSLSGIDNFIVNSPSTSAINLDGGVSNWDKLWVANTDTSANSLTITGDGSGTLGNVNFSGIEQIYLGSSDDSVTVSSGGSLANVLSGSLDLGEGNNSLTFNSGAGSIRSLTGGYNNDTITLNGGSVSGTVNLSRGTNQLTINDSSSSIGSYLGGTGADSVTLSGGDVGGNVDLDTGANTLLISSISSTVGGVVTFGSGTSDTLSYAGYGNAVTVSLDSATSTAAAGATGITGAVTGFESLVGGSGSDTLNANAGVNTLNVAADGTTTLDTSLTVSGFETINLGANSDASADSASISGAFNGTVDLGAGNDTATINNGGSVTSLSGGAGSGDTLNLDGANQTIRVTATGAGTSAGTSGSTTTFANFESVNGLAGDDAFTVDSASTSTISLDGGTGTDSLSVANTDTAANSLTISGAGSGTLGNVTFSGLESIALGSGGDTATVNSGGSLSGNLDLGAGNNNLTLATGAGSLSSLSAGIGNDTITINGGSVGGAMNVGDGTNQLTVSGTSSSIGSYTGGTGADSITLSGGDVGGNVDLGTGSNSLLISSTSSAIGGAVTFGSGTSDSLSFAGYGSAVSLTLSGITSNAGTTTTGGATGISGIASGFESLTGSSNTDSLVASEAGNTLILTGANQGTVDGLSFASFESVDLAGGNDTAQFTSGDSLSGTLAGGSGSDTLDYSSYGSGVNVNLAAGTATGTGGISGFETVQGGASADTITASTSGDVNLQGNAGADTFNVTVAGLTSGDTIDGGADADTLVVTDAGTITDSQFTNISNLETVTLTGATTISAGSEASQAGVATINTGTGATTVNSTATGYDLTVNAANLADSQNLTLSGSANTNDFTVTNLTGSVLAGNTSGTLSVTTGDAIDNAIGVTTGTGATTITADGGGDTVTTDATRLGQNTLLSLFGAARQVVTNLVGNLTGSNLSGSLNVSTANAADNGISITTGSGNVVVEGGDATDTVTVTGLNTNNQTFTAQTSTANLNITAGANDQTITASNTGSDTIAGGSGTDTLSYAGGSNVDVTISSYATQSGGSTGQGTDTFSGIESLVGATGSDILRGTTANTDEVATVSGANSGTIRDSASTGSFAFSSFEQIDLKGGNDSVTVNGNTSGVSLTGGVDMGSGTNSLTMSGSAGSIASITSSTGDDTISIKAGSVTGAVSASDGSNTVTISGVNSSIGSYTGGSGTDSLTLSGGDASGNVFTGTGNDSLLINSTSSAVGGNLDLGGGTGDTLSYGGPNAAYGASFDGSTSYAAYINEPETSVSREIVFSTTSGGGLFSVDNAGSGSSGGSDRILAITSDGNVYSRVWNNEVLQSTGLNLTDGATHRLVFTLGSSGTNIYVDGTRVLHGNLTASAFNWDVFQKIGFAPDSGVSTFNGTIDSYRTWNTELTADQANGLAALPTPVHAFEFNNNTTDTGSSPVTLSLAAGTNAYSVLPGSGYTNPVSVTLSDITNNTGSTAAGGATAITGTATGFETLEGGSNNADTITDATGDSTLAITGGNSGTLDGMAFSTFENLNLSGGNDTATVSGNGSGLSLYGNLDLGEGTNSLTMNSSAGTVASVNSGTGTDTFSISAGSVIGAVSAGDGSNTLTISGTSSSIGSYLGGSGTDSITLSGGDVVGDVATTTGNDSLLISSTASTIGGNLDLGGGTGDTLSYVGYSNAVSVTLTDITSNTGSTAAGGATAISGTATGFENLIGGSSSSDSVTDSTGDSTIVISGPNSGTIDGLAFSSIEYLNLSTGIDGVTVQSGGSLSGNLDLADGSSNSLLMNSGAGSIASVSSTSGNDTFTLDGGSVTGSITAGNGSNSLTINNTNSSIGSYTGGSGIDTIESKGGDLGAVSTGSAADSVTLSLGAVITGAVTLGANTDTTDGNDSLTLNASTITGNVNTGSGADGVSVLTTSTITGNVTLGTTTDSADGDDSLTVTGSSSSSKSVITGSITTGAGGDSLNLTNATIGGAGQTLTLGSDNNGLDGNDSLIASGTAITAAITTGSGADSLTLSASSSVTGNVSLGIDGDTPSITDSFDSLSGWTGGALETSSSYYGNFLGRYSNGSKTNGQDVSKSFALNSQPATLSFDFIKLDSWDAENFRAYINDTVAFTGNFRFDQAISSTSGTTNGFSWTIAPKDSLANNGFSSWQDQIGTVTISLPSGYSNVKIGFGSDLNSDASDESYGIDNLSIIQSNINSTDTLTLNASTITGNVTTGSGADGVSVLSGSKITGSVNLGSNSDVKDSGDSLTVTGVPSGTKSEITGSITTGGGADTLTLTDATIGGAGQTISLGSDYNSNDGIDALNASGTAITAAITTGSGSDSISLSVASSVAGNVTLGSDGDTTNGNADILTLNASTITGNVVTGSGADGVSVLNTSTITGNVTLGSNSDSADSGDTLTVTGASSSSKSVVTGSIATAAGADSLTLTNSTIGGAGQTISLGTDSNSLDGNDLLSASGTAITATITGGSGADELTLSAASIVSGNINLGIDGDTTTASNADTLSLDASNVTGNVTTGSGADAVSVLNTSKITGNVTLGSNTDSADGADSLTVTGTSSSSKSEITGSITTGGGADILTLTNATIGSAGQTISLGTDTNALEGNDSLNASGTSITANITTGSGSDVLSLSAGSSVTGDVTLGSVGDNQAIIDFANSISDSFNSATGWTGGTVDSSNSYYGSFLGRYAAGTKTNGQDVYKSFSLSNSPATISFDFNKFDSWDGESFKAYINDTEAFSRSFTSGGISSGSGTTNGFTWTIAPKDSLAGHGFAGWSDQTATITITLPAGYTNFNKLGFGSTLDQGIDDESYGIDNLTIIPTIVSHDDSLTLDASSITGNVTTGSAADTVRVLNASTITGNVTLGSNTDSTDGVDTLTVTGASSTSKSVVTGSISTGAGADTLTLTDATIGSQGQTISLGSDSNRLDGNDRLSASGTAITSSITTGSGSDELTLTGSSVGGNVSLGSDGDNYIIDSSRPATSDSFNSASGWTNGTVDSSSSYYGSLLGRYANGSKTSGQDTSKSFNLGGSATTLSFDLARIDNWNGELFRVYVDDTVAFERGLTSSDPAQVTGVFEGKDVSPSNPAYTGNFNTPANGGEMPWWGNETMARDVAISIGTSLGTFATNYGLGPIFAFGTHPNNNGRTNVYFYDPSLGQVRWGGDGFDKGTNLFWAKGVSIAQPVGTVVSGTNNGFNWTITTKDAKGAYAGDAAVQDQTFTLSIEIPAGHTNTKIGFGSTISQALSTQSYGIDNLSITPTVVSNTDTLSLDASSITGNVSTGSGADTLRVLNASTITGNVTLGSNTDSTDGADILTVTGASSSSKSVVTGSITTGAGADTLTLTDATIGGDGQTISLGSDSNSLDGNDSLNATGTAITAAITTGSGSDRLILSAGSSVSGNVSLGANADNETIIDAFDSLSAWNGGILNTASTYYGSFLGRYSNGAKSNGQDVSKSFTLSNQPTLISFDLLRLDSWDSENFTAYINDTAAFTGNFHLNSPINSASGSTNGFNWTIAAKDSLANRGFSGWNDQTATVTISLPAGYSTFKLGFGSSLDENYDNESYGIDNLYIVPVGSNNDDTLTLNASSITGNVIAGNGADQVSLSNASTITGNVTLGSSADGQDGNDSLTLTSGSNIVGNVDLGAANDTLTLSTGISSATTIKGDVAFGVGNADTISYSGNAGPITVALNGISADAVGSATGAYASYVTGDVTGFETIVGSDYSAPTTSGVTGDTIYDNTGASLVVLSAANAGTIDNLDFSSIENLQLRAGADTLSFQGTSGAPGLIAGRADGGGVDGATYTNGVYSGGTQADTGVDLLDYTAYQVSTGASVDLSQNKATGVFGGAAGGLISGNGSIATTTTDSSFENVDGSRFNDTIIGDDQTSQANVLRGFDGADTIKGLAGNDVLDGGNGVGSNITDGADTIQGGDGADTILGSFGNDSISGGSFESASDDSIDTLTYSATSISSARIEGLDISLVGTDTGTVLGDANSSLTVGTFTSTYNPSISQQLISAPTNQVSNDWTQSYTDIQNLVLSEQSDILRIDTTDVSTGSIDAKGGNLDTLNYSSFDSESSVVVNLSGAAYSFNFDSDPTIDADTGEIELTNAYSATNINIGEPFSQGGANGVAGFEVVIGGAADDAFVGNASDNLLAGNAGDDRIDGGAGNDTIYGGTGDDYIVPGEGADYIDAGAGINTIIATSSDIAYDYFNPDPNGVNEVLLQGNGTDKSTIVAPTGYWNPGAQGIDVLNGGDPTSTGGTTTYDTVEGTGSNDTYLFGGVAFKNVSDVKLGAGSDSVGTAAITKGSKVNYDGGSGSDKVTLNFTFDQLARLNVSGTFVKDVQNYLDDPNGKTFSSTQADFTANNFESGTLSVITPGVQNALQGDPAAVTINSAYGAINSTITSGDDVNLSTSALTTSGATALSVSDIVSAIVQASGVKGSDAITVTSGGNTTGSTTASQDASAVSRTADDRADSVISAYGIGTDRSSFTAGQNLTLNLSGNVKADTSAESLGFIVNASGIVETAGSRDSSLTAADALSLTISGNTDQTVRASNVEGLAVASLASRTYGIDDANLTDSTADSIQAGTDVSLQATANSSNRVTAQTVGNESLGTITFVNRGAAATDRFTTTQIGVNFPLINGDRVRFSSSNGGVQADRDYFVLNVMPVTGEFQLSSEPNGSPIDVPGALNATGSLQAYRPAVATADAFSTVTGVDLNRTGSGVQAGDTLTLRASATDALAASATSVAGDATAGVFRLGGMDGLNLASDVATIQGLVDTASVAGSGASFTINATDSTTLTASTTEGAALTEANIQVLGSKSSASTAGDDLSLNTQAALTVSGSASSTAGSAEARSGAGAGSGVTTAGVSNVLPTSSSYSLVTGLADGTQTSGADLAVRSTASTTLNATASTVSGAETLGSLWISSRSDNILATFNLNDPLTPSFVGPQYLAAGQVVQLDASSATATGLSADTDYAVKLLGFGAVNDAADTLTMPTGITYQAGDAIRFRLNSSTAPNTSESRYGLALGTTYYVKTVTGTTFTVAASLGGAAINLSADSLGPADQLVDADRFQLLTPPAAAGGTYTVAVLVPTVPTTATAPASVSLTLPSVANAFAGSREADRTLNTSDSLNLAQVSGITGNSGLRSLISGAQSAISAVANGVLNAFANNTGNDATASAGLVAEGLKDTAIIAGSTGTLTADASITAVADASTIGNNAALDNALADLTITARGLTASNAANDITIGGNGDVEASATLAGRSSASTVTGDSDALANLQADALRLDVGNTITIAEQGSVNATASIGSNVAPLLVSAVSAGSGDASSQMGLEISGILGSSPTLGTFSSIAMGGGSLGTLDASGEGVVDLSATATNGTSSINLGSTSGGGIATITGMRNTALNMGADLAQIEATASGFAKLSALSVAGGATVNAASSSYGILSDTGSQVGITLADQGQIAVLANQKSVASATSVAGQASSSLSGSSVGIDSLLVNLGSTGQVRVEAVTDLLNRAESVSGSANA